MKTYRALWILFSQNKFFGHIEKNHLTRLHELISRVEFARATEEIRNRWTDLVVYQPSALPEIREAFEKYAFPDGVEQVKRPLDSGGPLRFPPSPVQPAEDAYFQKGGVSIAPQEPFEASGCDCGPDAVCKTECRCSPPLDNEDIESLKRMDDDDFQVDDILTELDFPPELSTKAIRNKHVKRLPKKSVKKKLIKRARKPKK
jgi:hypothetical protein